MASNVNMTGALPWQVEKLSIIPRSGGALGFTYSPPKAEDKALMFDNEMRAQLAVLMGGRAAEALTCNFISNGTYHMFVLLCMFGSSYRQQCCLCFAGWHVSVAVPGFGTAFCVFVYLCL